MGLISHETFNFAHYIYLTGAFYGIIFGTVDAGCAIYANHKMRNDYLQKSPKSLTIHPKTTTRTLFFVEKKDFHENFSFKLKEKPSGELVEVSL